MENNELQRGLSARQMQMIALGGTIGVGLFMGGNKYNQMDWPISYFCILNRWYIFIPNYESNGGNDLS